MKKRLIGLFLISLCIFGLNSTSNALALSEEELDEQVTQVLDELWKEHGFFNYQIVKTEPTISIGIDASKDKVALQSILERKLPKQALEIYEIEIFQRNKSEIKAEYDKYK
ncbi:MULTISPECIES: hypothetical protein [Bacillus]|uniref:hypothetical protein n=1 Tax=Bacillus TaxID=1386 RepID=UPI000738AEAE|nr:MULTISPECIES: hypothetical protein [Bacillus]KUF22846.1 hypothetical protein AMR95_13270 [Bacillus sp. G1(2015b)]MCY7732346.1 hypothetical protein [Bacillus safensis]MEC1114106.1 hypothetical protein [Bacillus safensis]TQR23937.1 hypothetical protein C7Y46_14405 [Bacillus sp. SDF0016]UXC32192.1 hypothetical protein N4Q31_17330 [Bacillus safensis]